MNNTMVLRRLTTNNRNLLCISFIKLICY